MNYTVFSSYLEHNLFLPLRKKVNLKKGGGGRSNQLKISMKNFLNKNLKYN